MDGSKCSSGDRWEINLFVSLTVLAAIKRSKPGFLAINRFLQVDLGEAALFSFLLPLESARDSKLNK